MTPASPLITLTTDFGLQDAFVGIMKGVIAGICPTARIIDLTHGVRAFDVLGGALAIGQAWRYFPAETIHVIVVDPGVGSERLPVLARLGDQWFIAPDNGVLTLVERQTQRAKGAIGYRQIENPSYRLPATSSTFHGRDIFAPAAAHLAAQMEQGEVAAESFGRGMEQIVQLPIPEPVPHPDGSVEGAILKSDTFGNLLTNISPNDLPRPVQEFAIEIGDLRISRYCRFFAEADRGELFAVVGSSGMLELAVNRGSAQQKTGIQSGAKLRFVLK
ncbi:MAG: SAM-dependent chlorinase/fluorinase [Acidobacteriaceae bacterium]